MSPVTLSERGRRLLEDLPPELADAPQIQTVVDVLARELERLEGAATEATQKMFPPAADDEYGTLKMWEALLGLPVALPGLTLAQRQALVRATVKQRRAASGAQWAEMLTTAIGSSSWSHHYGPGDYVVTITIPYVPGGIAAGQVVTLARRVTPAHLQVNAGFTGGFLIGISNIGDTI